MNEIIALLEMIKGQLPGAFSGVGMLVIVMIAVPIVRKRIISFLEPRGTRRETDKLLPELVHAYKDTAVAIVRISETLSVLSVSLHAHTERDERNAEKIMSRLDDVVRHQEG